MDLLTAIKTRRTARSYGGEAVPVEIVDELLRLAVYAPSACNKQGWKFILLQRGEDLSWLYKAGGAAVLKEAKQALVVCYQSGSDNSEWDDNIQSAAAIIAYFQLIAHNRGVGSCWICHLPPKRELSAYFSIPHSYTPVAVVSFGYYKDGAGKTERNEQPAARMLAEDRWDFTGEKMDNCSGGVLLLRKVARALYYMLPRRGWLRGLAAKYEKKFNGD